MVMRLRINGVLSLQDRCQRGFFKARGDRMDVRDFYAVDSQYVSASIGVNNGMESNIIP